MAVRDRPPSINRPRSTALDREPVTTDRIGRPEHAKPWHPCGIPGADGPLERPGGSRLEGKGRFEVERTAGIDHRTDGWAVSTERQPQSAEVRRILECKSSILNDIPQINYRVFRKLFTFRHSYVFKKLCARFAFLKFTVITGGYCRTTRIFYASACYAQMLGIHHDCNVLCF